MTEVLLPPTPTSGKPRADAPCCPRCQSAVQRVQRRVADRLLNHFTPVHRFRCLSFHCHWEFNLRVARRPGHLGDSLSPDAAYRRRRRTSGPDRLPASFVIPMALAAAGLLFVVLGAPTDWLLPEPVQNDQPATALWTPSPASSPAARLSTSRP